MDKNTPITWGPFEAYMDKFQENLEGRFQKIDKRFDVVDDRFDSLKEQIGDLAFATKTGFDNMDKQFSNLKQEIHIIQNESSSNRVRLKNLETHIA
jgi:hypothetical protein